MDGQVDVVAGLSGGSAIEGKVGQEVERYVLHEIGMYLQTNQSDPHEEVLGVPQNPALGNLNRGRRRWWLLSFT